MLNTTLCYIEKDECFLMLYRNKKKNDLNAGKWVGVGGKFEPGETADECVKREVFEETGLTLTSFTQNGIVEFYSDRYEAETMYVYTADGFTGTDPAGTGSRFECVEGDLRWIPKEEIMSLPMWEGDPLFLKRLLNNEKGFQMAVYYEGNKLVRWEDLQV